MKKEKCLLQYSGGKDSTACLVKLIEEKYEVEAVHFTHKFAYSLPTHEAMRICKQFNVKINIIDISESILSLFCNGYSGRPCRICKGIMDGLTVDFAKKNGYTKICVGDTKSDLTLVNRVTELDKNNIVMSKYFNRKVELPDNIWIYRPLIDYTNKEVLSYLNKTGIHVQRVNDTGDKYFDYSREGCPLQFKDYGVSYDKELMERLKIGNSLCSEFSTKNNIRASLHLPSETIITIPTGKENECRKYLEENGFVFLNKKKIIENNFIYQISVQIYPEISTAIRIKELLERFCERLSLSVIKSISQDNLVYIYTEKLQIHSYISMLGTKLNININSVEELKKDVIENLLIELFHTQDFSVVIEQRKNVFMRNSLFDGTRNTRYLINGVLGTKIIRGDLITDFTEKVFEQLNKYRITTFIDLRNEDNLKDEEIYMLENNGIRYVRLPFIGRPPYEINQSEREAIASSYMNIVHQYSVIREILLTIYQNKSNTYFFCKHGKDRTGIVAALIELISGRNKYEVIEDYMLSYTYLSNEEIQIVKREDFEFFMESFFEEFGNIEKYIKMLKLDAHCLSFFYRLGNGEYE